jgi:hypothetical protein
MTKCHDVHFYEQQKVSLLRQFGFPEKELWLTEVTTARAAIYLYGEMSEIAEIIHENGDKPFVLYYHESGDVHYVATFANQDEFISGCQWMAQAFIA